MSNYSENPKSVRVDFFRSAGKWYTTEAIIFDRYHNTDEKGNNFEFVEDTFKRCLREQLEGRFKGMIAVCLDPYHENGHPLMVRDW